jgi:hypothetical protein
MARTIMWKTKGKAKEKAKTNAHPVGTKEGRELVPLVIGIYLTHSLSNVTCMQIVKSNNNRRSRTTSISHHRNLPIYNRKFIGFFFNNKRKFCFVPENKPTNQEPCCCRFFFSLLLLPLKLHRSLQKTGVPLGPFATYWVLTDCVHQCTSPCCGEQRRHKNPLSQPVPDLHPNMHPKSRCTQISLPLSLSNWSCCC